MPYALVLFDFDGTLADSFPWFSRVLNDVADELRFRRVDPADVDALRGLGPRAIMRHLGVSWWKVPFIARRMRQRMHAEVASIHPFDGVPAMLQRLADARVELAVVTSNAEANVRAVLGPSAALVRHWECRTSLFGKAARFRSVLRQSGIAARDALCVGDELRDAEAARAAGIDFAAVAWGYATRAALLAARPAFVVDRVDELADRIIGERGP
jgi:phosphoglycolate phosphatase